MSRKALALAAAIAAISVLYAALKPPATATVTHTATYTTTVIQTIYDEPVKILVLDPRDLDLETVLNNTKAILANFTDPYTFVQALYLAKQLGNPPDVLIAYWSPYVAMLAEAGVLRPIDAPEGLKYRNKTYGVPISIEAPLLICNKSLIQPPRDIFQLLDMNTTAPYLIALYLDPILLSPVIYGAGGAYYNGSYKALEDPRTINGFSTIKKLLQKAHPQTQNYTAQREAFRSGQAACILTIERLQTPNAAVIQPANKTLAYYKAAYAITERGKRHVATLPALWPQLERLGYTTPPSAPPGAEPAPVTAPGLDPLLPAVHHILTEIEKGNDPETAVAQVVAKLRR